MTRGAVNILKGGKITVAWSGKRRPQEGREMETANNCKWDGRRLSEAEKKTLKGHSWEKDCPLNAQREDLSNDYKHLFARHDTK